MKRLYEKGLLFLEKGIPFALATIIEQQGSSPRGLGAKMIICKDGSIEGTIGGGLVESKIIKLGIKVLEERQSVVQHYKLTNKEAAGIGMVCGGEISFLVHCVLPEDPFQIQLYKEILMGISNSEKLWLASLLPTQNASGVIYQCLIKSDSSFLHNFEGHIESVDLNELINTSMKAGRLEQVIINDGDSFVIEPIAERSKAYLFGAGHISHKLEPILRMVGFYTVVTDDRFEYANRERFPEADEIIACDSMSTFFDSRNFDDDSYIIIVTRGHLKDKEALSHALKSKAGYIGMIGSKAKREEVYSELMLEGFSVRDISRVYSPIGLPIQAETPEEIAVSIAAQLIQVRGGKTLA